MAAAAVAAAAGGLFSPRAPAERSAPCMRAGHCRRCPLAAATGQCMRAARPLGPGRCWDVMGGAGMYGAVLGYAGLDWNVVGHARLYWAVLHYTEL